MANSCLQLSGFILSFIGWLGIIVATATNDWTTMCKYGLSTCKKMDALEVRGPWEECVISTGLYHCVSLTQLLDLPAYIQTTRALMIIGSILGLPAVGILLMSMPCISLCNEPQSSKNKRTVMGGVLVLLVGVCGAVSTIWFPLGAHQEHGLMSFGFSLYTGWAGTVFSLVGGAMLTCSSDGSAPHAYQANNNQFYYSKQGGAHMAANMAATAAAASTTNHARSAHV